MTVDREKLLRPDQSLEPMSAAQGVDDNYEDSEVAKRASRMWSRVDEQHADAVANGSGGTEAEASGAERQAAQAGGGQYGVGDDSEKVMTEPRPTPEVLALQEEAKAAHPNDEEAQLDYVHRELRLGRLRRAVLATKASAPNVARSVQDLGVKEATPLAIAEMFDYVFDSRGIAFNYESYAAWMRLVNGQGTVADVRFVVHELTEIGLLKGAGVDFMGSHPVGTKAHQEWFNNEFEPAYNQAHARALYAEYQFLADMLDRATGMKVSPAELAAIDPESEEGREYMALPDGTLLKDHERFSEMKARADELITVSSNAATALAVRTSVRLADLLRAVRLSRTNGVAFKGAE